MITKRHCSILEFGRGASNQAVAPGIATPLHATASSDGLVYFHDLKSLLQAMDLTPHKDEEWKLFIDSSKGSLN